MKYSAAVLAGAVASASAASQSYSTIYEYYSDCGSTTTGPPSTATGTQTYHFGANVTNIQTDAITICPTCTAKPEIYPEGKTVDLTTYTTVYSCPGVSGLEEKTYTITEPCPTPGLPHSPGYVPQGFAVSTVQCTACPGSPNVVVTGPVAEKTAAPGAPGSSSPGAPGSPGTAAAPGSPGSAASPPGAPGSGSSSPGAPGSGSSSPGAPGSGSSSPGAPGSGSSSPGAPESGSSSPGAPESGSSSPGAPGSGSSSPGAAVAPPYPIPGASEARGGAAPSGTAAPSGSVSPVTPFKGAATKLFAISLSFVVGVAGFVGFYFI